MRTALIIIHDFGDSIGNLTYPLLKHEFICEYWCPQFQETPKSHIDNIGLVISLGGVVQVGDKESRKWQNKELAVLEKLICYNVPVLGICLGAQLLATLYGQKIFPILDSEIGVYEIIPKCKNLYLDAFSKTNYHVFQWHSYGFECPDDAELLADSIASPCQAFSIGDRILGTQFHIEATCELFRGWVLESLSKLENGSPGILENSIRTYGNLLESANSRFFDKWLTNALAARTSSTEVAWKNRTVL